MLTPLDIQKQEFDVKFRGYNADEVDSFLDIVGSDYEKLYKENAELKQQIKSLLADVEKYRTMESTLKESILLAQSTADDVKQNANQKASNIIAEANNKAADIIKNAEHELAGRNSELSAMKLEIGKYQANIRGICNGILEILDKME